MKMQALLQGNSEEENPLSWKSALYQYHGQNGGGLMRLVGSLSFQAKKLITRGGPDSPD
jgi:hypothetical protein